MTTHDDILENLAIGKASLGKRKQGLVKWLMKKGVDRDTAKLIAHRKFLKEQRHYEKYNYLIKPKGE